MKRIALVCQVERTTLGWLNVESGEKITVAKLGRDFEPVDGPAVREALIDGVVDGQPLMCPRCHNEVIAAPGDQNLDAAIAGGVSVLLGSTKVE